MTLGHCLLGVSLTLTYENVEKCPALKNLEGEMESLKRRYEETKSEILAKEIKRLAAVIRMHVEIWHDGEGKCKIFKSK